MPLIARDGKTGERVDITQISAVDVRLAYQPGDLVCPQCGSVMHLRSGHFRKGGWVNQHFVHTEKCDSNYESHPESVEHNIAKVWVRDGLSKVYSAYWEEYSVELEVPIEMDWRDKGRIADVLIAFPTGWKEAHEIQLSPITVAEVQERTLDYERAGINVTWWFGMANNKAEIRDWAYSLFGTFYLLEAITSQESRDFIVAT